MNWSVPRMWVDSDVWILGGGPSIIKQFGIPEHIVKKVVGGEEPISAYSPYFSSIYNKHVIGINVAFMIGEWLDMVFFGDNNFYLRYQNELSRFPGLKVTCHHDPGKQPWIKYLSKDYERPRGISTRPDQVSWNGNSGAAAISIATWAGASRIFLLGFDMQLVDKRQHFHDVYQRGKVETEAELRKRMGDFNIHLRGFDFIKQDAMKLGIEIINVNPDSVITEFPKIGLSDIL